MSKNLKIATWNVNALSDIIKRKRVVNMINKEKVDIICIQETHRKKEGANELKFHWAERY